MRARTVIVSFLVHAGLVTSLLVAAKERATRRATAVALAETRKKVEKPKPKSQPLPPRPVKVAKAQVAPKPVSEAKATAPTAPKAAAPVATAVEMSNDDATPGGIVVPTKAAAPAAAAAAPKVASAISEARKQRQKAELGAGPGADAPCEEEPTKPEPVFKAEIEYTAAARAEGVEGKLKLKLTVGADGAVNQVEVLAGVWPELDAAAIAAAKQWRFKPATACGKPVEGGTYILARRFELGD